MKINLGDEWGVRLGSLIDEIFGAAEKVKDRVYTEVEKALHTQSDTLDYYPAYHYPPMNVFIGSDRSLVLEMALAGFELENIRLRFQGDFLYFSADWTREEPTAVLSWLKKRLKSKSIAEQKYFVPSNRFDQAKTTAQFHNGLLTIVIPSLEKGVRSEEIVVPIQEKPSQKD